MTKQQSFKRRVRDRMDKTGERYTAARRQLLEKKPAEAPADLPGNPATGDDQAVWSGLSGKTILQRTGRNWDEWFALLDAWEASSRKHPEIARWLVAEHGVDGWWAQSITVGYEQARGIRAVGQRSDGTFSATASKTMGVPVERIFDAFTDETLRERWLPGARVTIRSARRAKSMRVDWEDGSTRVLVGFTAKDADKGQVALEHQRLADGETATEMKAYWRERLAVLKQVVEGQQG